MPTTIILRQNDNRAVDIQKIPVVPITGAWVDVSELMNVKQIEGIAVWVDVTINDSKNLRFRAVSVPSEQSVDEFNLPIQTVESDIIKVKPEFFEFEDDIDQKILFQVSIGDLVPYVKIQVQAGLLGATVAVINQLLASVTKKGDY